MATHILESMSADSLNRLYDGNPPSKKRKTSRDIPNRLSTPTISIRVSAAALKLYST